MKSLEEIVRDYGNYVPIPDAAQTAIGHMILANWPDDITLSEYGNDGEGNIEFIVTDRPRGLVKFCIDVIPDGAIRYEVLTGKNYTKSACSKSGPADTQTLDEAFKAYRENNI